MDRIDKTNADRKAGRAGRLQAIQALKGLNWVLYGVLFISVALLAWSVISFFRPAQVQRDSSGNVLNSSSNFNIYSSQAGASGCGNLSDSGNVQHLSHHPSLYANCLEQVDPTFLQQVTGKTLQQILNGSGGM